MIGMLKGVVIALGDDEAVIDVGGVGYLVSVGSRALSRLTIGAGVTLHIETYVREDALRLFGFLSEAERAWFVRLQAVQGVGAKHALALLDAVSASGIETASALGDAPAFERAKGVGKKLAERIAMELKGKAPPARRRSQKTETLVEALADGDTLSPVSAAPPPDADTDDTARDVAISALINLGYGESEARHAVALAVTANPDAGETMLIRSALKELAR
ncbi:MAG: holliday junction DNA helicase RuvA [Oceanicaulis sp. HLUCCA04]|nr:MAG: holliday junction DNA helicase RuvA [Oceanicaulis sp. HLUCCA04]